MGEALGEWWDREIFASAEAPDGRCPKELDVTGRARCLLFGPYLPLTPGHWSATAHLEVCVDAARCRLAVEFGAEPDYALVDLPFGQPGQHAIELTHEIRESGLGQIRLFLKRAAFHGEVRFIGATVRRIGDL